MAGLRLTIMVISFALRLLIVRGKTQLRGRGVGDTGLGRRVTHGLTCSVVPGLRSLPHFLPYRSGQAASLACKKCSASPCRRWKMGSTCQSLTALSSSLSRSCFHPSADVGESHSLRCPMVAECRAVVPSRLPLPGQPRCSSDIRPAQLFCAPVIRFSTPVLLLL